MVRVETQPSPYEVVIGRGVLDSVGERLRAVSGASRVALVTDHNVAAIAGTRADVSLARAGFLVESMSIEPGERSKSWDVAGQILEALAGRGLERGDAVVALGGGVIGDLAGFCAATYLRGIDFVQVPTTLLAQVDSSVGGKTGVDLRAGKNLAGAFKQPLLVVADTEMLATLPQTEWASGMAEVVKSAIIDSEEFTSWLEANAGALASRDLDVVGEAVERCVTFKAGVVSADERESGPRECLNYGHTLGHAIEKVAGYGVVAHGIAVAEGMRFAARLAVETAGASIDFVRRQDRLLDAVGLPFMDSTGNPAAIHEAMYSDKKARGHQVRFVLPVRVGQWMCSAVEDGVIREHLSQWAAAKAGDGVEAPVTSDPEDMQ
jgi:3-dehydroquinate synthase